MIENRIVNSLSPLCDSCEVYIQHYCNGMDITEPYCRLDKKHHE